MEEIKLIDESSQQLKAILDGIGEGISIIDEDLKIVWVNPILEKWVFYFLGGVKQYGH